MADMSLNRRRAGQRRLSSRRPPSLAFQPRHCCFLDLFPVIPRLTSTSRARPLLEAKEASCYVDSVRYCTMSSQVQLWRVSLPASDGDAALSSRAPPASAARLITLACDIYQLCLESLAKRLSKPLYRKVERPYGYLRLWADGYGVSSGELDKVLADSTRLRRSTVRLLVSLCRTLTNRKFRWATA